MTNSWRRILIGAVFLALAVIQTSLAPHFSVFAAAWFEWINFITLSVLFFALFERRRHRFSWILAVWGGVLLSFYSQRFFGFWIIALATLVFMVKFGIKKYVRIPWYW